MISISVRHDFTRFRDTLTDFQRTQLPFATARALTAVVGEARKDMQEEMRRVFDRPTPFTINSLRIEPATKRKLEASIFFKDFAPKGTPAGKYLKPQIEGGGRSMKRSEMRLSGHGVTSAARRYLVPRSGAEIDAFGNINRGQIVKVLSQLNVLGDQSAYGRQGKGKRRFERYFAVSGQGSNRGSRLSPGVYQRLGNRGLRPIYGFVQQPQYTPRLDFFGFAQQTYNRHFPALMGTAMEDALRTARK